MDYATLPQALLTALDRFPNPRMLLYKSGTRWDAISSQEFLCRIASLSQALSQMGLGPGDRVGLYSGNRPEWHIVDFAVQGAGGVIVPIYFRESQERMQYILSDSGAKFLFAAGDEQVDQVRRCREKLTRVEHVIAGGTSERHTEFLDYEALTAGSGGHEVEEYRRAAAKISLNELATIIYTSGTTGDPKGVMLSHSNLSSNAIETLRHYDFGSTDLALSFLPLAHVYERTMDYGYMFRGVPIAYLEFMEHIPQALLELHPTIAAAVPRVFEKTYASIMERGQHLKGVQRRIFDWAMSVALAAVPWKAYDAKPSVALRAAWALADRLIYRKIRAGVGGRMRCFPSGSAPLEKRLAEFFWSTGMPVYEGYGLTETSPVVTANLPMQKRVGTVGKPIEGVEVRIAEDGEILVRGACVMQGYCKKPEETRAAFTQDGFLKTGDIGRLDADGFLLVTDRKKELLKTAAGKFVAPQPVENRLKTSAYISNAVVVGDRRKFVSLLIVPNFATLRSRAQAEGHVLGSNEELVADSWARNLIAAEVDRLTADLAQYEKPKRFAILNSEFTYENGELTYTMKLRRKLIEERYGDVIEQLYADVREPLPPARA